MLILSALITGIATGSMYGLLALGFHVTWAVSRTVNFAQGSSMMLGAVLLYGLAVTHSVPGPVAVVVALALCGVYGLIVERCVVRPFVVRGSEAWLMATVAVGSAGYGAGLRLAGGTDVRRATRAMLRTRSRSRLHHAAAS